MKAVLHDVAAASQKSFHSMGRFQIMIKSIVVSAIVRRTCMVVVQLPADLGRGEQHREAPHTKVSYQ